MYTPNNDLVFTTAFAGALSGMTASGRNLTSGASSSYDEMTAIAGAFAQEFDTLWGPTASSTLELETIQESCEGVWSGRSALSDPTALIPANWQSLCAAIIAIVQSALAYYAAQGIPNPPAGGGNNPVLYSFTSLGGPVIPPSVSTGYVVYTDSFNFDDVAAYEGWIELAEGQSLPPSAVFAGISILPGGVEGATASIYVYFGNLDPAQPINAFPTPFTVVIAVYPTAPAPLVIIPPP